MTVFEQIKAGLEDAIAYQKGDLAKGRKTTVAVEDIDVAALRHRLELSQYQFARRFGFPLSTLRKWEQGARRPSGASRTLLTIIDREPNAVERALARISHRDVAFAAD